MSEEKKTIRDQIKVLASEGNSIEYKELIENIEEQFNLNCHKVYDSFHVTLVKDTKIGTGLIFEGEREESQQETMKRESEEAATKKRVEDAELKEYLRLKRKYGKKVK